MAAYQEGRLTEHQEPDGSIGDANKINEPTNPDYANREPTVQSNSPKLVTARETNLVRLREDQASPIA